VNMHLGGRCSRSGGVMLLAVVLLAAAANVSAFYLPGVAPTDYSLGDKMQVKVEALTSVKTQLPYEYYVLPFCHDGVNLHATDALNLGEVLKGSRIYETPYIFHMGVDQSCKILCRKEYDAEELQAFALMIQEEYRVNMLLDNLPIAMTIFNQMDDGTTTKSYEIGYPIGFADVEEDGSPKKKKNKDDQDAVYLFNHLRFTILYNEDPSQREGRRMVGFEVEPFSVKHSYQNMVDWENCVDKVAGEDGECALSSCAFDRPINVNSPPLLLDTKAKTQEVIWSYDIVFKPSPVRWSTRWDAYLSSSDDAQIHWFSILNSFMVVIFLSGLVGLIMVHTLRKDFQRYERGETLEEGQEETGWKLVHGDVFRTPPRAAWLAVLIGTGTQLCVSCAILLVFACLGFLSPANRGALMQATLFLFVFMGMFGGYTAARFFRMFKGTAWRANALWTAMLFPGTCFGVFFVVNLLIWGQKSSGAVPFTTLLAMLLMWLCISVPLVLVGAFFGYRMQPIEHPVRVNQIPRQVPEESPLVGNAIRNILVGGILPFGAVFVEVFYVLSSIWQHQIYYLFGILFLVLVILLLTCSEVTIVMCYFQLCCENYHWWWRAFFTGGCSSLYVFLYSIYYAYSKLKMARTVATIMYICYMFLVSCTFFLITGSVGFLATFMFVRAIYAAIKVD